MNRTTKKSLVPTGSGRILIAILALLILPQLTPNLGTSFAADEDDAKEDTAVLSYEVTGMSCNACAKKLTLKLSKLKGVTKCEVSFDDGDATICVAKDETEKMSELITKCIGDIGYKCKLKTDDDDGEKTE